MGNRFETRDWQMMSNEKSKPRKGPDVTNGIDPHSEISRKLRQIYQEDESEEIPEQFLDLLEQLDAAEQKQGNKGDE